MYNIEKTLFVTDLDGTLLRNDAKLSPFTVKTINDCIARGMKFSFATARSFHTAMKVAGELDSSIPMILHNGAFIQKKSGEYLHKNLFGSESVGYIRRILEEFKIPPIVYSIIGGREYFSYAKGNVTPEAARFIETRRGDPRDNPLTDESRLYEGEVYYISCLGIESKLSAAYRLFEDFTRIFQPDFYSGDYWLELLPPSASKASAVLRLKEMLECEYVVVFGDAKNDISMFGIADEGYAVANAVPELKDISTGIIGSNETDGVAKFLRGLFY